jgi:hypothetical protein
LAGANRSNGRSGDGPVGDSGGLGARAAGALRGGARGLGRWIVRFSGESARAWRYLDGEQRVAAIASVLLIISTFGSAFSFVEAAIVLVGLAVLLLLKKRADGRSFHLPFGDGAVILAAGVWSGLLIVVRLFDRPLGQNLLALVCATLLALAGLRMRLRRPADDLPAERARARAGGEPEFEFPGAAHGDEATTALPAEQEQTAARPRRVERQQPPAQPPAPGRAAPPPAEPPASTRESPPSPEKPGHFRARPAEPPRDGE